MTHKLLTGCACALLLTAQAVAAAPVVSEAPVDVHPWRQSILWKSTYKEMTEKLARVPDSYLAEQTHAPEWERNFGCAQNVGNMRFSAHLGNESSASQIKREALCLAIKEEAEKRFGKIELRAYQ